MATATALDRSARKTAQRLINKFGRTLIVRRPVRMDGPAVGQVQESPLSTSALLINGAKLAGATTLDLDAASVTGLLVAGDGLAIAGDATAYTVTGGPHSPANNVLTGVGIAPALAVNAANGAAVTVTFSGTDYRLKGVVASVTVQMINAGIGKVGDVSIIVAKVDLEELGIELEIGNDLYYGDSVETAGVFEITGLAPIPSGELDAAITFIAKAA